MILNQPIDQAIRQLNIKTNNTQADREELSKILFEILGLPMVEDAHIHKRANKLGGNDLKRNKKQLEDQLRSNSIRITEMRICRCCGNLQNENKINCCEPLQEIDLGVGVRLYFMSLAHHAIILTIGFFLYTIYSLITNIILAKNYENFNTVNCLSEGDCGVAQLSSGAKAILNTLQAQEQVVIQMILGVVFIVFWGVVTFIRQHRERKLKIQVSTNTTSAAQFTLMISNFPKVYLNKSNQEVLAQVKRIFKDYQKKTGTIHTYQVVKVNVAPPLYTQRQQNKQRRQKLKQEMFTKQSVFRKWIDHRRQHHQFPIPLTNRQIIYQQYIQFYIQKYDQKEIHECPLQDKNLIFVTMRSSAGREDLVKNSRWRPCKSQKYKFPIKGVTIENAPEPQQIVWENVGFPFWSKLGRKIFIYFISLICLGVSFGITIGITYVQVTTNANLAIVVSLIITGINFIIEYTIYLISFLENEVSKTTQQASIAFKISLSQLLNSIGIPIALAYIGGNRTDTNHPVFGNTGLANNVFYIGLFSLLTPLWRFFDPYNIFLKLKKDYYNGINRRLSMYGQAQLNQHYACYEMDLGYEYAFIIKTTIFTAFFMSIQPIIVLFASIGLGLIYAVNKYKLFYRFHRPKFHTFLVNDILDWILGLGAIAFALGQIYTFVWAGESKVTTTTIQIIGWVGLGIAGFLYIFSNQCCYFCVKQSQMPNWDFYEKKALLPTDFDRLNPATKQQAIGQLQNYFQQLQMKQQLPNQSLLIKASVLHANRRESDRNLRSGALMSGTTIRNGGNNTANAQSCSSLIR